MLECPNCRQRFRSGTRFCGSCGTSLAGTMPVVASPNLGAMEPEVSGQPTPGFQAQDSLEDTLVRKMPDGFSWQSQRTTRADDALQQASGLASAAAEEITISITTSTLRPNDSPTPGTSVTPFPPHTPISPAIRVMHVSPDNHEVLSLAPVERSVSSGVMSISGGAGVAARPAKVSGEHMPFAIPARPGRAFGTSAVSEQLVETPDEVATASAFTHGQTAETPDSRTALDLPGDLTETPVDYTIFNSADVSEKVATTRPLALLAPGPITPAPEIEVPQEPALAAITGKLLEADGVDTIAEVPLSVFPATSATPVGDARLAEADVDPVAHFAPFLKPADVPAHLLKSTDPYLHLKLELSAQRVGITIAMDELLPLVYDNHREENQTLFAGILANHPPLDDASWGHAAFVLGAYGNYMYRNQLSFTKKLEVWRAQLWAVYYERSYRRKYLAQRCQQLIHFFQGCAENPLFLVVALHDLETLYLYLEPGSLRKLQQMLQTLPSPPADLLRGVEARMLVAEEEKTERMAKQPLPARSKIQPPAPQNASKPTVQPVQQNTHKPTARPTQTGVNKPAVRPAQAGANRSIAQRSAGEELGLALQPEARKLLSFLSEEQCRQFFDCLRTDRLEVISQLLLQARTPILMALRAELLNTSSLDYQRPRKSVPLCLANRDGSEYDRFADAFRLLSSPKLRDQQAALRMFEQNMHEDTRKEYQQGAREWVLYARALTQGSTRVAADWERDIRRDEASWEEIWNLAYYHRMANDLAEAARILASGLNELDAPVSHLRLALICTLTLLLKPGQVGVSVLQNARDLLIHHLERWPHPLSCLAWLALSYEVPGTLRPLDQSRRLSAFQELLEYPVNLPDPHIYLTEQQMGALEDALVSKTHCDEAWFLWLNDYAARHPHNFPAWQRLAETSERLGRLERAEMALQHSAGIYYDLDYVYAQEGEEEVQAAAELRLHVEKLFDFYRRHELHRQAWDSFESCYATLKHHGFWDEQKPANRRLLALVRPFLIQLQHQEAQRQEEQWLADAQDAQARSEIRRSELSGNPTRPLEHFKAGQRVGIFVDYENIARLIPREEEMENVWQMLASYAAQFGDVVSRWASASPRNLSNLTAVRAGLEAAQFKIRYPRRELQFSASQKDLADYALLECITNASLNDHLDVYLVVSGDRDYYERIYSLLENKHTVHILASACNLSTSYRDLEQQRQHKAAGREEPDFFIDDLDEVLRSFPPASH